MILRFSFDIAFASAVLAAASSTVHCTAESSVDGESLSAIHESHFVPRKIEQGKFTDSKATSKRPVLRGSASLLLENLSSPDHPSQMEMENTLSSFEANAAADSSTTPTATDASMDLGILATNTGTFTVHDDVHRYLNEDSVDCDALCSSYGERPEFTGDKYDFWDLVNGCVFKASGSTCPDARFALVPINCWDVSQVDDMREFFNYEDLEQKFNEPIECWDTSKVRFMDDMFAGQTEFNQPLNRWSTSLVWSMNRMFEDSGFNQPLSSWDTQSVDKMHAMFNHSDFNQPIGNWDVRNNDNFDHMFQATPFNQPLDKWVVSGAENLQAMFRGATSFNQCLSTWSDRINIVSWKTSSRMLDDMFEDTACPYTDNPEPGTGPWCQNEQQCTLSNFCNTYDDSFHVNGNPGRSCEWIADRPEIRCRKDSRAEIACPGVCSPACLDCDDADFASAHPSICGKRCTDSPDFLDQMNRSCEWVAENPDIRCARAQNSVYGCPASCNDSCPSKLDIFCNTYDDSFRFNGNTDRDCEWIGDRPEIRCDSQAEIACPGVCSPACLDCDDADFASAHPSICGNRCTDNPEFLDQKNRSCEWVAEKPDIRCAKAQNSVYGCPASCDDSCR